MGATLCGLCCAAKNRANASVRMHASACASIVDVSMQAHTHTFIHTCMYECVHVFICKRYAQCVVDCLEGTEGHSWPESRNPHLLTEEGSHGVKMLNLAGK